MAIAAISQAAIVAGDVDALVPEAAEYVTSLLHVPVVAIAEFMNDGRRFRIRGGLGCRPPGVAGSTDGAAIIAALAQHSPIVVDDASDPSSIAFLRELTSVHTKSFVAIAVEGEAQPWGFVLAGAATRRTFSADDIEFISAIARVVGLLARRRGHESRALVRAQERFAKIFQISPMAVAMATIDEGRVLDVNERWLAMLGFQRDEVIGRTNAELRLTVDARRRADVAMRARADGVVRDFEMQLRTKSGAIIDVILSVVPVDIGHGEDVWIAASVDITDRKRAGAERDELLAREQLARAEAEQALDKLDAVYSITDGTMPDTDLGELLGELLKRLRRTLQLDQASVLVLDDEGKALYLRAIDAELPPDAYPSIRVPLGAGVSGRIAAEGRAMIINDYGAVDVSGVEGPAAGALQKEIKAVMGAPFRIRGKVGGVVMGTCTSPREFTREELKLLVLAADRVAPAIERGRLIAKVRSGLERQRALSYRLLSAQEAERRRLAVELHDELGQVLTAVKINLESLARTLGESIAPHTLTAMIGSVDQALQQVRDIALDLRPSVLDDLGLSAAMRWYVDRFARAGRVEAHLSIGVLPPLDPALETACFRVAQEALTNVDRHAHAHHVWIDLHVLAGALELSIRDDGIGFDVAAARQRAIHGASVGLLGMQERVALMDGEYEIVKVGVGGTEVRARFPLTTSHLS